MFGISFLELLVIFGAVLIIFGPDKLPQAAQNLGRFVGEFRKTSEKIKRDLYEQLYAPPRLPDRSSPLADQPARGQELETKHE